MMGRNRNAGKPGAKNPGKTFKRIFAEIMSNYKVHCIAVVICLFISAVANVYGTMFMQRLIDDYITPMMGQPNPDFGPWAVRCSAWRRCISSARSARGCTTI